MYKRMLHALCVSAMLLSGTTVFAQGTQSAKAAGDRMAGKPGVTYGRVKELTAGQKVVIDVDNAVDKTFDLADKDVRVSLAKGLKVGDPVMISELDNQGKKSVRIVRHSGGGVKHGDRTAAGEKAAKP